MLYTREFFVSRLPLSEPAEAAKLALTDAEYAIDSAMSHLHLDAVTMIRALLRSTPAPVVVNGAEHPRPTMLQEVITCVEQSLVHLCDGHRAAKKLCKNSQLIAADREETRKAMTDVVTAQIILSEVLSVLATAADPDGSKVPGTGERLLGSLSQARESTCNAYQRLEDLPTVVVRLPPPT